ncbi:isocitrate lyase/PEP mutase family protein [Flavisphingomonas formosensis]|uniref:isocitrate lyase/PEP mutase family protein n=1 Tax=Flavisphingomonas formosensis TaxID=861534 RepID=UPI0012F80542|nr:isocitrate lyase/PEP mutase family protein [Sphingomonas formosensis]
MRKTTRLRKLIEDPRLLVMPGAYDALSARIAEEAGFQAVQASGANIVACHFGVPDYSLVSAREMAEHTGRIANAVDVPVMGDADTGFGNAVNAYLTVQQFERVGAAGVNIEDQVIPKRCGHLEGKTLLDIDEAVAKIQAAADAREDKDFVINARTDALGVFGLDEAIRRGNAYLKAGATMVFLEGADSAENIEAAVKAIDGPVAVNLVEGGKTPSGLSFAKLQALGIARVSLPSTAMQATVQALRTVFGRVNAAGGIEGYEDLLCGFGVAQRLLGLEQIFALEDRYMAGLVGPAGDQ